LDMLKELRIEGSTMVGIFHDPGTLAAFADRIYEMPGR
jgi:alpha-D-ribose 1-methylphosphonate 5-triphosphate synthase subunit PhnL